MQSTFNFNGKSSIWMKQKKNQFWGYFFSNYINLHSKSSKFKTVHGMQQPFEMCWMENWSE